MDKETQFIFEIEPEDPNNTQPILDLVSDQENSRKSNVVRLDKWLWAARFFKTRALARSAIEEGRILYEGQKTTPSKEIQIGAQILINQGKVKRSIEIRQLSTRRRSTDEAHALFEEVITPFYPNNNHNHLENTFDTDKKPRKVARFLRRALAIGEFENQSD